ncbi:Kinase, NEK [Giardia lamblia P15]|uniref:Kinase, NEK n=1 Tax=Giardia intestinalis (strain P15) TaxID=658858 RepID=E1EYS0_GIAIA|nr:Kinase, NEK [Giardia lamblia P15]
MHPDPPEPTAEAPNVPEFTSKELHERLDSELGKGATGIVYALKDFPGLAVKEILLDGLGKSNVDAIRLELAALPDLFHPGIIKYHQVIENDGLIYIIMNRHDRTLEQVFFEHRRRKSPVSPELVRSVMSQVAAALAYLHSVSGVNAAGASFQGLVHRDLKLANVLISADGERFIIADFGLCKDALRCGSTTAGTVVYMAPEALLRGEATPASDVWSLGVIAYELATLRRPDFLGGREPAEVFVAGWKPDLNDVTDGFIRDILERIFTLEPERRPTAKELCKMLTTADIPVDELGPQYVMLKHKCGSLEVALNGANAEIALLKDELKANSGTIAALEAALDARSAEMVSQSAEIAFLREALETKAAKFDTLEQELTSNFTEIDALKGQGKEHLAMIKALENRLAQFSNEMNAGGPQTDLLLLPRLMRAAHTNSTETVRVLLEEGVRTGRRDEQGMTALMHAAQQGHVGPVELLVEKEKGLRDRNGWTALMHAVHNNHSNIIKILVPHEHGKRANNSRTALMMAVANSCVEAVRALVGLEHGLQDLHGHTALMMAAERGHAEIVSLLVPHEEGLADSRGSTALMIAVANSHVGATKAIAEHEHGSKDSHGRTALMIAAEKGNLEIVEALVEHEKEVKDSDGCTALVHAARAGHRDVAELLMAHEKDATGWTVLMLAAALGDTDLVSQHLDDKGKKDKQGQTALIIAAQNGRDETVKLLMKHEGGASGWTNLIYSAYLGDIDAIKENLHEKGCTDLTWASALMRAAHQDHQGAVEILFEHEKGMTDKDGNTAFMYALNNKHTSIAMFLREHEAPSWTPLMCASFTGDIETARKHLSERDKKNNDDDTALMLAARKGNKDIIELLDPIDENGVTALMRAAGRGDTKTTELLIPAQRGMKDKDGNTAFVYALSNKHIDTAMLLQGYETHSWTPLMCAALAGDIEAVKMHLSDKNKKNSEGDTALIIAARAGYKSIVELLDPTDKDGVTALMRAADRNDLATARALAPLQVGQRASGDVMINNRIIYKGTALMRAAARGHAEIVELLLEKEGGMTNDGWTALMSAAAHGHPDCVELLLEKEGGMKRSDGWTALMSAAQEGHPDCVKLLLEKEGGMKRSDGWTALMSAAQKGHPDCVKLLLEKEGGMTNDGWTALMSAAQSGHPDCASLLLEREKHMRSNRGETALDIAKRYNHPSVVSLLSE